MKTDELGVPRFTNKDLVDMIYSGHVDKCHVVLCDPSDDIEKFNAAMREQYLPELTKYIPLDVDQKTFDGALQSEWFMPDEYKILLVGDYIQTLCITSEERARVQEELEAYNERGMYPLLQYMIYLVDFMRENNIVWGVGRGSSVASYVLYLIGVHRIDSIQYDLDWTEFLR
jgi:DNA polymerase III alpha subunit|tara:strand:- start:570 stop:1085 length:516 start_codon:yes stop_codon:yes gene_type:complete